MFKMLKKSGLAGRLAVKAQQKTPSRAAVQPGRIMTPADVKVSAGSPLKRVSKSGPKPAPKKVPIMSASAAQKRGIASMLGRRRGF